MRIIFKGRYKSIESFEWNEIPMISILTGKNGVGKSQLLNLITSSITQKDLFEQQYQSTLEIEDEMFRLEDVVYLTSEWIIDDLAEVDLMAIQQARRSLFESYILHARNLSRNQQLLNDEKTGRRHPDIYQTSLGDLFDKIYFSRPADNRYNTSKEEFIALFPEGIHLHLQEYTNHLNIGRIFYDYRIEYIESKSKGMTDEEFYSSHPQKPWITVNEIFNDIHLPFELNNPEEISIKDTYKPVLRKTNTKEEISFNDLSSGEKVLVSLVFWLFNSEKFKKFPRLLLLDEPDAHLHPSMAKQFIEVIKNVLSDKYGVRIIMTSHSPSTIALAPEESIFLVNNSGDRIQKSTKDQSLKTLTSGVPSFSIVYENRRQVFVESSFDVSYYEKLYQKLSDYLEPEISLNFISSGESRTDKNGGKVSSCDQVINITDTLRRAGNNFVWGIVDWDTKNKSSDFIKVLGEGNRYSIESYLFDPLLVAAVLLRHKFIKKEDLNLDKTQTYIDLKNLSENQLQFILEYIVNQVGIIVKSSDTSIIDIYLINKKALLIPTWYLHHNGHDLETAILKAFPQLNSIKRDKEELLKSEIVNNIIDDLFEILSVDILNTFRAIQAI